MSDFAKHCGRIDTPDGPIFLIPPIDRTEYVRPDGTSTEVWSFHGEPIMQFDRQNKIEFTTDGDKAIGKITF